MPNYTPLSMLNEMIAAGWGSVPQAKIPANWRELRNPEVIESGDIVEWRMPHQPTGVPTMQKRPGPRLGSRKSVAHGARLDQHAAQMRERNANL